MENTTTYLTMKYHPAKKEIKFKKVFSGKETAIKQNSVLMTYMQREKGKFILQDHGNAFFRDIMKSYDGVKELHISVITTKLDYIDFEQMVEYYNNTEGKESGHSISTELFKELPDMNVTFEAVRTHGEKAIGILTEYGSKLKQKELENSETCEFRDNLVKIIESETNNIKEITEKLENTNVNLCFTGAYSSGKSTLINALLGAQILPVNIGSKTAKMFIISSPINDETVKIEFEIEYSTLSITWDTNKRYFVFNDSSESDIQRELQSLINENRNNKMQEQLLALLKKLNDSKDITSDIRLSYPIPLDNSRVKYTIYDTPGTDSNHSEHKKILTNALSAQAQSILVFVGKPDGLEGSANNALLDYLREAEKKAQTNIDISRSVFVINKADTVTINDRKSLQNSEIKYEDDNTFSISLKNKKLLFVSARDGRIAAELKNGNTQLSPKKINSLVDNCDEEYDEETDSNLCYRQDKVGDSQLLTNRLILESDQALNMAKQKEDNPEIIWIGTGMFALESEINIFGEKYASAVRAYAIISSVEKSLDTLSRQVEEIQAQNEKKSEDIEDEIKELKKTINSAIEEKYKELEIGDNDPFPDNVLSSLGIDSDSISQIIFEPLNACIEELDNWTIKKETKTANEKKLNNKVNELLNAFSGSFLKNRKSVLSSNRDEFMGHIKDKIKNNGDISEEGKQAFLDLPSPQIRDSEADLSVEKMFKDHLDKKSIFWGVINWDVLDKTGLYSDLEQEINSRLSKKNDEFKNDYQTSLKTILDDVVTLFEDKLKEYSVAMAALLKDSEETMALGDIIQKTSDALKESQKILDKKIWESE